MVCLARLRGMVYFLWKKKKKKIPGALFTHREVPHLTSLLTTWHTCCVHHKYLSGWQEETETAIEETCSSYFEEFHGGKDGRRGERGKKYTSEKVLAQNKAAMEKYWYFMHGNTTTHLKNADVEKTRLNAWYKGYMKQVELWEGEGVLLWDKWAVFFNIDQSSVKWTWMELGLNDRISLTHTH